MTSKQACNLWLAGMIAPFLIGLPLLIGGLATGKPVLAGVGLCVCLLAYPFGDWGDRATRRAVMRETGVDPLTGEIDKDWPYYD